MSDSTIESALRQHLDSMPGRPEVAWEGVSFTPSVNTPYLKVAFMPDRPTTAAGSGSVQRDEGIFQVTVVHPFGKGSGAARELADAVVSRFKRGTSLTFGGATVVILKSWQAGGVPSDGWYRVPVSIRYFSHSL